jgi:hypothetical protein
MMYVHPPLGADEVTGESGQLDGLAYYECLDS